MQATIYTAQNGSSQHLRSLGLIFHRNDTAAQFFTSIRGNKSYWFYTTHWTHRETRARVWITLHFARWQTSELYSSEIIQINGDYDLRIYTEEMSLFTTVDVTIMIFFFDLWKLIIWNNNIRYNSYSGFSILFFKS